MTTTTTHAWCSTCAEEVPISHAGLCLWCDAPTTPAPAPEPPKPKKRRGGRPKGKYAKLTDEQIRYAHRLHIEGRLSLNELGRRLWKRFGYASPGACANSLSYLFKDRGLRARDRIEQTVISSTKHGHARRSRRDGTEEGLRQEREYRRWLRDQRGWRSIQGPGEQQCEGIRSNHPNKGKRCERPAMTGERFCQGHHPDHQAEVARKLAAARERMPQKDFVPMAAFAAYMQRRKAELGTLAIAGAHFGVSKTTISNWCRGEGTVKGGRRGKISQIGLDVVTAALAKDGLTPEELYR